MACAAKQCNVGGDCGDAWRKAIANVNANKAKRPEQAHTAAVLTIAMEPWVGWSCSTSGVEQNLAMLKALQSEHSKCLHDHALLDLMTICCDRLSTTEEEEIISRAQSLWSQHYGFSRQGSRQKVARKQVAATVSGVSEKKWLQRRTLEVTKGVR